MNFRIPPDLDEMVEVAVEVSGAESRSAFARDCLEAGARREIAEHRNRALRVAAVRISGVRAVGVQNGPGGGFAAVVRCTHPPTAIRTERPDADYCSLCSAVLRVKI